MSRAGVLVVLALLLGGGGAAALAVVAVVAAPAAEVVPVPAPEVVPDPTDRDVLAAAAAGADGSVQRDGAGRLVLVVPGRYDALTVEQVVPAPAALPAGTPGALAAGAVLALAAGVLQAAGRRGARPVAALATSVLAATGAVVVLVGPLDGVAVAVLVCAGLTGLAAASGAHAFSR